MAKSSTLLSVPAGSLPAGETAPARSGIHTGFPAWQTAVACTVILAALAWAYAGHLFDLAARWSADPAYSHGYLVPVFAGYLLWRRRRMLAERSDRGRWFGLLLLGLAAAMLWASAYWYYALLAPYSLLPCLAGICLWLGGLPKLKWAAPAVAFLFFMVPLPGRFADMLGHPLQRVATKAATWSLQVAGIPAVAEGNVIQLSEAKIGVVEACSGLRMLILFFALSTAVALLIDRRRWERLLLVASAVPIAVAANVIRISVTAMVHEWVGPELADLVFHDLAGWLMMPLALGLLWIELALLSRLFIEPPPPGPVALAAADDVQPAAAPAVPPARSAPAGRTRGSRGRSKSA